MIEDVCDGVVYFIRKQEGTYKKSNVIICSMKIQYDIDCLQRTRTVGYSDNDDLINNRKLPAHRIDLPNNPGEIFENQNSIRVWYPLYSIDYKIDSFNGLGRFLSYIDQYTTGYNSCTKKAYGEVYLKDESIGNCHCSNCNGSIDIFDKFCRHCGYKIIKIIYSNEQNF